MTELSSIEGSNVCEILIAKTEWSIREVADATSNTERNVRRWLAGGKIGGTSKRLMEVFVVLSDLGMTDVISALRRDDTSPPYLLSKVSNEWSPANNTGPLPKRIERLAQIVDYAVEQTRKLAAETDSRVNHALDKALDGGRVMLMHVQDAEVSALEAAGLIGPDGAVRSEHDEQEQHD